MIKEKYPDEAAMLRWCYSEMCNIISMLDADRRANVSNPDEIIEYQTDIIQLELACELIDRTVPWIQETTNSN